MAEALTDLAIAVPLAPYLGPSGCAVLRIAHPLFPSVPLQVLGGKPRLSLSEIILQYGSRQRRNKDESPRRQREKERFKYRSTVDEIVHFLHWNGRVKEIPFYDSYECTPSEVYPTICACLLRWQEKVSHKLLKWLVEKKADVNGCVTVPMDALGIRSNFLTMATPLVIATSIGCVDLVQALIGLGADCWLQLEKSSINRGLDLRPTVIEETDVATLSHCIAWHAEKKDLHRFWQKMTEQRDRTRETLQTYVGAWSLFPDETLVS